MSKPQLFPQNEQINKTDGGLNYEIYFFLKMNQRDCIEAIETASKKIKLNCNLWGDITPLIVSKIIQIEKWLRFNFKRIQVIRNERKKRNKDLIMNTETLNGDEIEDVYNERKQCLMWDIKTKRSQVFSKEDIRGLFLERLKLFERPKNPQTNLEFTQEQSNTITRWQMEREKSQIKTENLVMVLYSKFFDMSLVHEFQLKLIMNDLNGRIRQNTRNLEGRELLKKLFEIYILEGKMLEEIKEQIVDEKVVVFESLIEVILQLLMSGRLIKYNDILVDDAQYILIPQNMIEFKIMRMVQSSDAIDLIKKFVRDWIENNIKEGIRRKVKVKENNELKIKQRKYPEIVFNENIKIKNGQSLKQKDTFDNLNKIINKIKQIK